MYTNFLLSCGDFPYIIPLYHSSSFCVSQGQQDHPLANNDFWNIYCFTHKLCKAQHVSLCLKSFVCNLSNHWTNFYRRQLLHILMRQMIILQNKRKYDLGIRTATLTWLMRIVGFFLLCGILSISKILSFLKSSKFKLDNFLPKTKMFININGFLHLLHRHYVERLTVSTNDGSFV